MNKGWKKIKDSNVVTIWKSTCNCGDAVAEVELFPCDIAETGVPICLECGKDFEYVETRIKVS